jgi:hypothetical protein
MAIFRQLHRTRTGRSGHCSRIWHDGVVVSALEIIRGIDLVYSAGVGGHLRLNRVAQSVEQSLVDQVETGCDLLRGRCDGLRAGTGA